MGERATWTRRVLALALIGALAGCGGPAEELSDEVWSQIRTVADAAAAEHTDEVLEAELADYLQEHDYIRVFRHPITVGQSAAETCESRGLSCVAVTSTEAWLWKGEDHLFYGYGSPSCRSRIVQGSNCNDSVVEKYRERGAYERYRDGVDGKYKLRRGQTYVLDHVAFRKALDAAYPGVTSATNFCVSPDEDGVVAYSDALCIQTRR